MIFVKIFASVHKAPFPSLTPVAEAISVLIKSGMLSKADTKRLRSNIKPLCLCCKLLGELDSNFYPIKQKATYVWVGISYKYAC
jgi:hypothetical protein